MAGRHSSRSSGSARYCCSAAPSSTTTHGPSRRDQPVIAAKHQVGRVLDLAELYVVLGEPAQVERILSTPADPARPLPLLAALTYHERHGL
jgi:hypothetical protein